MLSAVEELSKRNSGERLGRAVLRLYKHNKNKPLNFCVVDWTRGGPKCGQMRASPDQVWADISCWLSMKEAGLFCCWHWQDRLSWTHLTKYELISAVGLLNEVKLFCWTALTHLTKYELMSAVGSLKEAGLFCCWLDRLPSVLLALKSR